MDPHDQQRDRGYDAGDDTSPTVPTGVTEPEETTWTTEATGAAEVTGSTETEDFDREKAREGARLLLEAVGRDSDARRLRHVDAPRADDVRDAHRGPARGGETNHVNLRGGDRRTRHQDGYPAVQHV